jgi:hypothetical protein
MRRAALVAVLGVLTSSVVTACVPAPRYVVGITTDAEGRVAVVVQRCDRYLTSATIWLRDVSRPLDELNSILTGPLGPEPVVVPLAEPSAAGWTAQPAVGELAAHRRYAVTRERMTDLEFDIDWFGQPPLDTPGSIAVDEGPANVMDLAAWRKYAGDLCD